jgi:hypothetical protein
MISDTFLKEIKAVAIHKNKTITNPFLIISARKYDLSHSNIKEKLEIIFSVQGIPSTNSSDNVFELKHDSLKQSIFIGFYLDYMMIGFQI